MIDPTEAPDIQVARQAKIIAALVRSRRSRGSSDVHTAQVQPIAGTPELVPVPRNTKRMTQRMPDDTPGARLRTTGIPR